MSLRDEIAEILCDDPDDPDTVRDAFNRTDAVLALLSEGKWHDGAVERMDEKYLQLFLSDSLPHWAWQQILAAAIGGET